MSPTGPFSDLTASAVPSDEALYTQTATSTSPLPSARAERTQLSVKSRVSRVTTTVSTLAIGREARSPRAAPQQSELQTLQQRAIHQRDLREARFGFGPRNTTKAFAHEQAAPKTPEVPVEDRLAGVDDRVSHKSARTRRKAYRASVLPDEATAALAEQLVLSRASGTESGRVVMPCDRIGGNGAAVAAQTQRIARSTSSR